MAGRPRTKNGKSYVFYLSDEVDALIEQYKGNLSRSNFIEKAVKFYISNLAENPKEGKRKGKSYDEKREIRRMPRAGIEPATFRSSV